MEHFEKNRNTLRRALSQLAEYRVPAPIWDRIQSGLTDQVSDEEELQTAVGRLAAYAPPPQVWNTLAKQLDHDEQDLGKRLQLRQWLSIAAGLALVISAGIWLLSEPAPTVKLTYSQETVAKFHYDLKLEEDEATFAALETELAQQNDPTLNKLQLELNELNAAREEVKVMLQSYGQDPQLVNQLSDIERVRSDIYRQIIEIML